MFDIVNFYPSITPELLTLALEWAEQFIDITDEEKKIIIEARKSLLIFNGSPWSKKKNPHFDVPMGSNDGAEVCDICVLFILSELEKLKLNASLGMFKDDGLGLSRSSPRQTEAMKKKICETFRKYGLEITIEANQKTV